MSDPKRAQIRVAFCGVDGSGKTTQANLLKSALESKFEFGPVVYCHGNRPIFKTDAKRSDQKSQISTSKRGRLLSTLILYKDLLKIRFQIIKNRNASVLIFDRFTEDALAKVSYYSQSIQAFDKLVRKYGPKADLVIWLDVAPETSFSRDREHSIEYHRKKKQAYTEVFDELRPIKFEIVSGDGDPSEVHAQIWRLVLTVLPKDSTPIAG